MAPLTVVSFVFNCQFVEIMGGASDVFVFPQARPPRMVRRPMFLAPKWLEVEPVRVLDYGAPKETQHVCGHHAETALSVA